MLSIPQSSVFIFGMNNVTASWKGLLYTFLVTPKLITFFGYIWPPDSPPVRHSNQKIRFLEIWHTTTFSIHFWGGKSVKMGHFGTYCNENWSWTYFWLYIYTFMTHLTLHSSNQSHFWPVWQKYFDFPQIRVKMAKNWALAITLTYTRLHKTLKRFCRRFAAKPFELGKKSI